MAASLAIADTRQAVLIAPGAYDLRGHESEDTTLYNATPFFWDDNLGWIQMVRHDLRGSERSTVFVVDQDRRLVLEAPIFQHLQDPFYLGRLPDQRGEMWHVIGGVRIEEDENGHIVWHDVFFRYRHSISELDRDDPEVFAHSFAGSKETRAVLLQNGRLGVFVRPQGEYGGLGTIGYLETDNIDALQESLRRFYQQRDPSKLLRGLFPEGYWGGVNQVHVRPNGMLLCVGHIAHNGVQGKVYEPMYFLFNPRTRKVKVLTRFKKNHNLNSLVTPPLNGIQEVSFATGIGRDSAGDYWLHCGINDSGQAELPIASPELLIREALRLAAQERRLRVFRALGSFWYTMVNAVSRAA